MKIKANTILLLVIGIFFIIIFPYTKDVDIFRAHDLNWEILKNAKQYKELDVTGFSFLRTYEFTDEIIQLSGSEITIKGFLKRHKHDDHTDITLTETVTDVCFMCDHDEHYNLILLKSFDDRAEFLSLGDENLIEIKGRFILNELDKNEPVFQMENVNLKQIINQ